MGSPFSGIGIGLTTICSCGSNFSHLNLFTTLCMNTSISNRAYSLPGHILGPPPNGTNVYGAGPSPSNRLASNFSGFGKYWGFLWVELALQYNFQPLGIVKPAYVNSLMASLNAPCNGGANLITSQATFHEYFIF
uniref:Uncharacterized protein n=1 Tax=Opuntia streptacantha TaxID=393608 RepID=A0A7C9E2M7_OPUST